MRGMGPPEQAQRPLGGTALWQQKQHKPQVPQLVSSFLAVTQLAWKVQDNQVVLAHSCMTGMRLQILQLQAGRMTSQAAHLSTVGIAGSAVTAAQQLPHHTLLVAPLCTLACHLQLWALLRQWPLLLPLLSVQGLSCQPPA